MLLRGKFGFGLLFILVLVAVLVILPAVSKVSLFSLVDSWIDQYEEAVDIAQEDDDDDESGDDDGQPAGKMQVHIDAEIGEYAGVETLTLEATSFFPESKALAKIVDLRPMLALRARYKQAAAALNVAKVKQRSAEQELARLKTLSKGAGSVATKKVNYAQTSLNQALAELEGLRFDVQAIKDEALQTWGETVANWVLAKEAKEWQRLLANKDSLLLVTLPSDVSLPADVSFIRVSRDGARDHARKAYYVSPAISTDQVIQGETYFFKTATGKLRAGMRLEAWLPKGTEPLNGVFIPEQAVVWSGGQPWAYVELEDELYERRSLLESLPAARGKFIQSEFAAGDKLVMRGAQMLLSEEFKWQIADEDDD